MLTLEGMVNRLTDLEMLNRLAVMDEDENRDLATGELKVETSMLGEETKDEDIGRGK